MFVGRGQRGELRKGIQIREAIKENGSKRKIVVKKKKKGSAVFPTRPLNNYVFVEPIERHCSACPKGYKGNAVPAIKATRKASFYFAKSDE